MAKRCNSHRWARICAFVCALLTVIGVVEITDDACSSKTKGQRTATNDVVSIAGVADVRKRTPVRHGCTLCVHGSTAAIRVKGASSWIALLATAAHARIDNRLD